MKIFGQNDEKNAPSGAQKGAGSMKDLYKTEAPAPAAKAAVKGGLAYRVVKKPMITEKASRIGAENKYMFEVAIGANKIDIGKAIAEVYGVVPTKVNIVRQQGKAVRYGRRTGQRKDRKKAIITLPAGKTINPYEGV